MTNFSKKPFLHPLTFDFVDMPHTRASVELSLYDPLTPHIHSIYLLHESTLERFEALRAEGFSTIVSHPALHSLRTIDARKIELNALPKVVSYASKLLNNREAVRLAGEAPLFTQYPKALFERRSETSNNLTTWVPADEEYRTRGTHTARRPYTARQPRFLTPKTPAA